MNLSIDSTTAESYKSGRQQTRVLTEPWIESNLYCVQCGYLRLRKFPNNQPLADFYCENCKDEYELKSSQKRIGSSVPDGDYKTMIRRLSSKTNPNLLLFEYDKTKYLAKNLIVVPKFFFTPSIIKEGNPTRPKGRKSPWVGCTILLKPVPDFGRIFIVRDGEIQSKSLVLKQWKNTIFLNRKRNIEERGWVLDVMKCIDQIGREEFTLQDVYRFENELAAKHPDNNFVRDKIRQQLRVLRDKGIIEFLGRGEYRLKK